MAALSCSYNGERKCVIDIPNIPHRIHATRRGMRRQKKKKKKKRKMKTDSSSSGSSYTDLLWEQCPTSRAALCQGRQGSPPHGPARTPALLPTIYFSGYPQYDSLLLLLSWANDFLQGVYVSLPLSPSSFLLSNVDVMDETPHRPHFRPHHIL